jgi:hypothetical protein
MTPDNVLTMPVIPEFSKAPPGGVSNSGIVTRAGYFAQTQEPSELDWIYVVKSYGKIANTDSDARRVGDMRLPAYRREGLCVPLQASFPPDGLTHDSPMENLPTGQAGGFPCAYARPATYGVASGRARPATRAPSGQVVGIQAGSWPGSWTMMHTAPGRFPYPGRLVRKRCYLVAASFSAFFSFRWVAALAR